MTPENVRRAYGLLQGYEEMIERIPDCCEDIRDMDTLWRALGNTIVILTDLGVEMRPHLTYWAMEHEEALALARGPDPCASLQERNARPSPSTGADRL